MNSADDYGALLTGLLPQGPAWSRDPKSVLGRFLRGWGEELARVEKRAADLVQESDPRTADEMIGDWERVLGLPDPCTAPATTLSGRRVAAVRKLAVAAGQTRAFYIALAAAIGFEIEIHEFDPGVGAYDGALDVSGDKWRFVWRVHVLSSTDYQVFTAGGSAAGDYLVQGGALDLECMIRSARPAHTHVLFTYA